VANPVSGLKNGILDPTVQFNEQKIENKGVAIVYQTLIWHHCPQFGFNSEAFEAVRQLLIGERGEARWTKKMVECELGR
jgi:hypothetical protein